MNPNVWEIWKIRLGAVLWFVLGLGSLGVASRPITARARRRR